MGRGGNLGGAVGGGGGGFEGGGSRSPCSPGVRGRQLSEARILVWGPKFRRVKILPKFGKKMVHIYKKQPKLPFDNLFRSENT